MSKKSVELKNNFYRLTEAFKILKDYSDTQLVCAERDTIYFFGIDKELPEKVKDRLEELDIYYNDSAWSWAFLC